MGVSIEVVMGDITKITCDAIVNAANCFLKGGGGVDGAIHKAGGAAILEACKKIVAENGICKVGEAVITEAGNLPAKYVIHTVGPVWRDGQREEHQKLAECYENSLKLAVEHNCDSISFPNISTGVYGFPKDQAATIAVDAVMKFGNQVKKPSRVVFVCFDEENYTILRKSLESYA
ncbi:MAG: O-acetyl-ADP-ribose deacetylase [Chitinophagales bacterium]|nr:O-acetyl-ADP-ribose deacetylase [Chitinophagales bacterium]